MNKLPGKLTLLRKHYQYSQGDIAQKLNIPVTEYMKWENGNDICSIQQLKQLADLYHVSLDVLADNAKDLVIPSENMEDSVDIPFMNGQNINMTQELDPADNMMPVDGVLPPAEGDTLQMGTTEPDDGTIGSTRVMDTSQFAEQEEDPEETYEPDEPKKKSPSGNRKKKKKQSMIIVASVCAAVVVLGVILLLVNGSRSHVSPGDDNRLAVGDTYSLYVDASGNLKTYGSFNPSVSFDGAVQVSAFDNHAAALLKNGKAVSSDGNKTVSGWEDLKYIAAGKSHTAAVKNDGTVVCAGDKNACQVGDWKNINKVYAGDGFTIGLSNDGDVKVSGTRANAVKDQSDVRDVAISDDLILLVKKSGRTSSFLIGSGEPVSTDSWTDVEKAAAGTDLAVGLKSNGTVEIEYSDEDVKAKVGEWKNIHYLAANGSTVVGIDRSGKMHGAGDNSHNQYKDTSDDAEASPSASADNALNRPENITVSATTANVVIKWNSVKNAGSYIVSISNVGDLPETTTNQASVAATSLVSGSTYTITVTAIPKDEKKYKESSASITYTYEPKTVKLDTPGEITSRAENGGWTISWSNVDHADYYGLSIDGKPEQRVNSNSMSINDIEAGTYTISIKAYSANSTYTESDAGTATVNLSYADKAYTVIFQTGDGNIVYTASNVSLTPGRVYTAGEISQASGGSQSMIQNHTITSGQNPITPGPQDTSVTVQTDN